MSGPVTQTIHLELVSLLTIELKPLHRSRKHQHPANHQLPSLHRSRKHQPKSLLQSQQHPGSQHRESLLQNKKPRKGLFYWVNNLISPTLSIAVSKM
jgi:hypothetical protein